MAHPTSHSTPEACLFGDQGNPSESNGNEFTQLLPGRDDIFKKPAPTPLPTAQICTLVAIRLSEPIAYLQIFPYINQLLVDMHVAKPDRVGLYSGFVESIYSLAEVFAAYQWGMISDVVGRRPVVFIGLIGAAAASITFGLSTSLTGLVISRFVGGLVAGNTAVLHSILAEVTDDTNQNFAVPIYSLAWPMGTVIGPLIGGTLENAATRFPRYFSWPIFIKHPYLPPCIASAICALVTVVFAYMLIEETLPSKRKQARCVSIHVSPSSGSSTHISSNEARPTSAMELLSIPAIRALTISGFILCFLSSAFDVVFTLFCYTPVDSGGLGLEPSTIGNILALAGAITIFLRFTVMPYMLRHFDYAKTYNAFMYLWPFIFGFLPFLNLLARAHPLSSPATMSLSSALFWTGVLGFPTLSRIGEWPYSLSLLLVKQHAPSSASLGRSNALVHFSMCVGRAIAPLAVNTLFTGVNGMAWTKRWGLGGLWVVAMVVVAVVGARVAKGLRS